MRPDDSIYTLCITQQIQAGLKRAGCHGIADVLKRSPAQLVQLLGKDGAGRVEKQIGELR